MLKKNFPNVEIIPVVVNFGLNNKDGSQLSMESLIQSKNYKTEDTFCILFSVTYLIQNCNIDKITDYILKNKILKNVRCLICQGQSVYDSESEFASSIKLIVDRKINEGLKEKQIYQFLREKYGDWVIFDPQLNKNTYVLWLLPLLLFLFGGAIMYKKIQKINF